MGIGLISPMSALNSFFLPLFFLYISSLIRRSIKLSSADQSRIFCRQTDGDFPNIVTFPHWLSHTCFIFFIFLFWVTTLLTPCKSRREFPNSTQLLTRWIIINQVTGFIRLERSLTRKTSCQVKSNFKGNWFQDHLSWSVSTVMMNFMAIETQVPGTK